MEQLAALVGVILLGLAVAGVPEQPAVALVVGAVLVLAPTAARFAGPSGAPGNADGSRPRARD